MFIGHGPPMLAITESAFSNRLKALGQEIIDIQVPNAIVVVSAHWLTRGTFVNTATNPKMIYDFGGFPKELSEVVYQAPGSPEYARTLIDLAPEIHPTDEWGLDHGAWTILKHLFPTADIPVFELSISYHESMQYHFDLARQLQALRNKGVLLIGSGNIVHNIPKSMQAYRAGKDESFYYDWAKEFDEKVNQSVVERNFKSLIDYKKMGSAALLAVPTVDHYVPLLYALGMARPQDNIVSVFDEVTSGFSMRCYLIGG
jgi:4,5-DOPA dioxygenase extradiol